LTRAAIYVIVVAVVERCSIHVALKGRIKQGRLRDARHWRVGRVWHV
jgi:hypothetical protein